MVGKLFRVIFARSARNKLRDIHEYNAENVSDDYAQKVSRGLIQEARKLNKLPDSRPLLPISQPSDPPYRYAKKWSFKIIFRVFQSNDQVQVEEFLHDAENPEKWDNL